MMSRMRSSQATKDYETMRPIPEGGLISTDSAGSNLTNSNSDFNRGMQGRASSSEARTNINFGSSEFTRTHSGSSLVGTTSEFNPGGPPPYADTSRGVGGGHYEPVAFGQPPLPAPPSASHFTSVASHQAWTLMRLVFEGISDCFICLVPKPSKYNFKPPIYNWEWFCCF